MAEVEKKDIPLTEIRLTDKEKMWLHDLILDSDFSYYPRDIKRFFSKLRMDLN